MVQVSLKSEMLPMENSPSLINLAWNDHKPPLALPQALVSFFCRLMKSYCISWIGLLTKGITLLINLPEFPDVVFSLIGNYPKKKLNP